MDSFMDDLSFLSEEKFSVQRSKDLFDRMEKRVTLQALAAHIREGGDRQILYAKPFTERIEEANEKLEKELKALTPNKEAAGRIQEVITAYESTLLDVYFSLGMKTGAKVNSLLMGDFDKDY